MAAAAALAASVLPFRAIDRKTLEGFCDDLLSHYSPEELEKISAVAVLANIDMTALGISAANLLYTPGLLVAEERHQPMSIVMHVMASDKPIGRKFAIISALMAVYAHKRK